MAILVPFLLFRFVNRSFCKEFSGLCFTVQLSWFFAAVFDSPFILPSSSRLVKNFFNFFQSFCSLFRSATLLSYHSFPSLSITFFAFFRVFLQKFFFHSATLLLYHDIQILSTVFLIFYFSPTIRNIYVFFCRVELHTTITPNLRQY